MTNKHELQDIVEASSTRFDIWEKFIRKNKIRHVAEVGVFRGRFAAHMLEHCPMIDRYHLIDPWRHIPQKWNLPSNITPDAFEKVYEEALEKTSKFSEKRSIHRGTTAEVIDDFENESLDFVYLDGDHTLRGITIDLIQWLPKVKVGGYIGGDDFGKSIFAQPLAYEPVPIFPYAVYFAEAMDLPIYGMPGQFLIHKSDS